MPVVSPTGLRNDIRGFALGSLSMGFNFHCGGAVSIEGGASSVNYPRPTF